MSTPANMMDWTQAPAILNLLNQYAHAYDSADAQMMQSLFSEHAVCGGVVMNSTLCWGPWSGSQTIAAQQKALRQTQPDERSHQITTPMFTHLTSTQAEVKAFLALFSTPAGEKPKFLTSGEYQVQLSRVDGVWKIDRIHGVLDGEF